MKAFMSEARHYDLCYCTQNWRYYGLTCACAATAVRETRRILAETEPPVQRDGTGVCMIRSGVRSSMLLGRQGQDALADALAAFVEG